MEDSVLLTRLGYTPTRRHRSQILRGASFSQRRMLELAPPEMDALGRTVWGVPAAEVSKAYRRLSVLVHPDKNPGDDARSAFEALNEAHRLLRDRGRLVRALASVDVVFLPDVFSAQGDRGCHSFATSFNRHACFGRGPPAS